MYASEFTLRVEREGGEYSWSQEGPALFPDLQNLVEVDWKLGWCRYLNHDLCERCSLPTETTGLDFDLEESEGGFWYFYEEYVRCFNGVVTVELVWPRDVLALVVGLQGEESFEEIVYSHGYGEDHFLGILEDTDWSGLGLRWPHNGMEIQSDLRRCLVDPFSLGNRARTVPVMRSLVEILLGRALAEEGFEKSDKDAGPAIEIEGQWEADWDQHGISVEETLCWQARLTPTDRPLEIDIAPELLAEEE